MKKGILVLLMIIFISSGPLGFAQESSRKKVVKIRPAQLGQEGTPTKTVKIKPRTIEETEDSNGIYKKNKEWIVRDVDKDRGPSGFFAAIKGGFAMPSYTVSGEVGTTFFNNILDKTDLAGRLGIGSLSGFGYSAWSIYFDLFLSWDVFRSENFPLTLNLGLGINYPFSVNNNRSGSLGFNLFTGVNYDIFEKGQLFLETGLQTLAVKNELTRTGVSLLLGYKHFF